MPQGKRFICIHGHFYQPPRENPWLETVEIQDSAAPYHDWNERVCTECYAPNGAARVVNAKNQIVRIVNNYARMSFNFGPTLLSWIRENARRTYSMILEGERRSRERYSGHSSAMAQAYNHMIMPLASPRDRVTQIRWGIADYKLQLWRRARGHVAAGDRCGHGHAGVAGAKRHQVHGACAAPVQTHSRGQTRSKDEGLKPWTAQAPRTDDGSDYDAALSGALRVGRFDRCLLLQRARLARHRV